MSLTMLRKLGRIPEMGPEEISYRLRETLRKNLDRAGRHLRSHEDSRERFLDRLPRMVTIPEGRPSFTTYLREVAAPRFYSSTTEPGRSRVRSLIEDRYPHWLPGIAAEAERLCEHRFECLGHGEIDFGPDVDWHRDPVTGRRWDRRFWADYDLVHDRGAGDPKLVHELNRHQHLPRLAKAYVLFDEERYAREVVAQMSGWIDQNPPGLGVNWHSSLEISLRVVSWMWALFLIHPSPALDEDAARAIGHSFFAQLDHVHAFPSLVSSPNTHLLGEAAALFLAGLVLHDCEGAEAWRDRGAEILTEEIGRQVLPDGVHGELSTWYHCYALDSYLQALVLARRNGFGSSLEIHRRVEQMLDFLLHVTRPDGGLPRLGDDDGGRALALGSTHYDRVDDLLAIGAVLYRRKDLKHRVEACDETALWLLGSEGSRELEELPSAPPPSLQASFPDGGYFVHRSGWDHGDGHLIFDCGGLGTLGGGHGHADALAVTLSLDGEELLVDPGTYVYNGAPAWRDGFRSTRAHNTAVVDCRDQSEPRDTFRWADPARVELLAAASFEGIELVAGEHHGYADAPCPVVHRRRILYIRPRYWLILDDFRGEGEHSFEILYHLAPGAELRSVPGPNDRQARWIAANGSARLGLFLQASTPMKTKTHRGGDDPSVGWVSRRYGEKSEAPSLAARFCGAVPASCISILAPAGDRYGTLRIRSLPVDGDDAEHVVAAEIRHDEGTDVVVLSPGSPAIATGDLQALGEAFWARFEGEELHRLLAIDGQRFEVAGAPALSRTEPITDFVPPPRRLRDHHESEGR